MSELGTDGFEARRDALRRQYLQPIGERPRSTAQGVHHVAMICSDVEATIRFYQGLLGFPLVEIFENRDSPGSTHFFFDLGHQNLLGFFDFPGLGLGPAVEAIGSLQHLAISVDAESFERHRANLDEAGVEYLGPDRGVEISLYFKDPNGIQVELLRADLYDDVTGEVTI